MTLFLAGAGRTLFFYILIDCIQSFDKHVSLTNFQNLTAFCQLLVLFLGQSNMSAFYLRIGSRSTNLFLCGQVYHSFHIHKQIISYVDTKVKRFSKLFSPYQKTPLGMTKKLVSDIMISERDSFER